MQKTIQTFKTKSEAIIYAYKYASLGQTELKRVFDAIITKCVVEMEHEVIIIDEFNLLG